jgi:hypothetical protein
VSSGVTDDTDQRVPENLYLILNDVFNKIWNLEIEAVLSTPFFGLITRYNCGDVFGMPDYFEKVSEACTLANIQVIFKYKLLISLRIV